MRVDIKYSFVLPAYKARFFREALDSILAQTYKDFELIIVNDASPENLDSIVKGYNDPRIRYYVNEKNIGGKDLVAQWNHCLEYAMGEYVILASDDDVYSPLYLEKMDELVCRYPDVNVHRCGVQIINDYGEINKVFLSLDGKINEVNFIYYWMKGDIGSGIPYYVFRKETLVKIGGFVNFPTVWGSDDATVIELAKKGVGFCPKVLFSFRMSGMNISSLLNNEVQLSNKLKAYKLFGRWLYNKTTELQNSIESKEKDYILNNYRRFLRNNLLIVLNSSSSSAIVGNLRHIYALDFVNWYWTTYWILRFLCKRLIY